MFDFKAHLQKSNNNIFGDFIQIPENISDAIRTNGNKRLICTFNQSVKKYCGLLSQGNGVYVIYIAKSECKQLGIQVNDLIAVHIDFDKSEYGIPMPEEMQELLNQDEEGNHYFHQLTPGKQRSILHLIGKPKSSEVRISKAIAIVNYLKLVQGKLDFKELNEALKKKNRI